jgi:RNase P subunit RPR2
MSEVGYHELTCDKCGKVERFDRHAHRTVGESSDARRAMGGIDPFPFAPPKGWYEITAVPDVQKQRCYRRHFCGDCFYLFFAEAFSVKASESPKVSVLASVIP